MRALGPSRRAISRRRCECSHSCTLEGRPVGCGNTEYLWNIHSCLSFLRYRFLKSARVFGMVALPRRFGGFVINNPDLKKARLNWCLSCPSNYVWFFSFPDIIQFSRASYVSESKPLHLVNLVFSADNVHFWFGLNHPLHNLAVGWMGFLITIQLFICKSEDVEKPFIEADQLLWC